LENRTADQTGHEIIILTERSDEIIVRPFC
jgi:hypothetical protein